MRKGRRREGGEGRREKEEVRKGWGKGRKGKNGKEVRRDGGGKEYRRRQKEGREEI